MAHDEELPAAATIALRALRFAAYTALAVLVAEAVAGERSAMPVRLLLAIVAGVAVVRALIKLMVARKGDGN